MNIEQTSENSFTFKDLTKLQENIIDIIKNEISNGNPSVKDNINDL